MRASLPNAVAPNANVAPPERPGIIAGAACGLLIWITAERLGFFGLLPPLRDSSAWIALLFLVCGAGIYRSRARGVLLSAAAALIALWLLVCLSPLARWMLRSTLTAMPPQPADAIVVLSSSIQPDGDWTEASLARLTRGLELARAGYAPLLIVTDVAHERSQMKTAARKLADNLRLPLKMETVGPVRDTHDEALAVARLSQERGWKAVLLVTSPSHSRRAFLVFRKTGLQVVSVPAQETKYDFQNPQRPFDRLDAFKAALHELFGLQIYRLRGWV